jgi:cyclopropane fatty-acyl-phospholipid synthase-like methyltransferase
MAEIRGGFRHLLAHPAVYDFFQRSVGAYAWRQRVLSRYAHTHLQPGASVLDIGCGTGGIVSYLPPHIDYHGFDRNGAYIEKARRRYPRKNVAFHCEEFDGQLHGQSRKFDLILAIGLIHHLEDAEVRGLMRSAQRAMNDSGMFLALDPARTQDQSALARFLVSHDRGRNVRAPEEYLDLARETFPRAEGILDENPLFIPYTGYVLLCTH